MKGKKFWKKCLLFDLCCLCLALGLIFTGTGKGAEMKQSLAAAAEKLEKTRQASGPAQEDAGASERKKVALTFDAVEGNGDTAQILETLKRHDVHATFFLTGGWAAG